MSIRVLCLGDIVGNLGTNKVCRELWNVRRKLNIDLVVANGENAEPGNGLLRSSADRLLAYGVDVITSGNHIWQKKEMHSYLDECKYILRPANYPDRTPGGGAVLLDANGRRALVMNVQGTVFMESLADPFDTVDRLLERYKGEYDLSVLDIHAEATSEKIALARYFDGRINVIVGTHTHVQTADEQILPQGSGYITDLGMCGVQSGVLGVDARCIIDKFRTKMPTKFLHAEGDPICYGAIFDINDKNGKVEYVERVHF